MMPTMEPATEKQDDKPAEPAAMIVLFDGTCGMCDAAVTFILKHDTAKRFRFAPQQSQIARELIAGHGLDPDKINSMVLIDGDHAYLKSSAVLRITAELPEPWMLGSMLAFLPVSWRDAAYDLIARHRKQWFKPHQECRVPTAEERERFLA